MPEKHRHLQGAPDPPIPIALVKQLLAQGQEGPGNRRRRHRDAGQQKTAAWLKAGIDNLEHNKDFSRTCGVFMARGHVNVARPCRISTEWRRFTGKM